ncbi:AI-2E family transporter [Fulvimarina sp. 2208YS6-2-32]|uniref:AI-2E family transporter n=1 Tax=Fulvimarina uroteuthidis TaxID=3098149 RepID=A0ABU5I394_9HYPH|nr:AI-2E family transporter [Fulvimarina sp. 2208YS6-2-32]MDY8109846.1 AI-2E family transporter [Fulvimarina sp. 2208YS6-2-32]
MADRSTPFWRQVYFWCAAAMAFVLIIWIFSSILLPFVLGMVIAYLLDPVADWFERRGLSRLMATTLILVLFVVTFVATILIIAPVISSQVVNLAQRMPDYLDKLQGFAIAARSGPLAFLFTSDESTLEQDFAKVVSDSTTFLTTFLTSIWSSSLAVVNFVSLFVVTPVVAFYLLLDWDRMVETVDSWLPRQHQDEVRRIAHDIDRSVAGFVRGQGSVCLILGTFYAVGLTLIGLNFGLLIGLFAGLISFIPYIGSLLGLVISLGVALVQFWPDWPWIVAAAAVFFVGQFFEGNILQPKLVGASVGLHPVWLMFALFAFGALFGFVGLLIAVPAAAAVGVLARFGITKYLDSEMYHGPATGLAPPRNLDLVKRAEGPSGDSAAGSVSRIDGRDL